jgi:hypothetical protein
VGEMVGEIIQNEVQHSSRSSSGNPARLLSTGNRFCHVYLDMVPAEFAVPGKQTSSWLFVMYKSMAMHPHKYICTILDTIAESNDF